MYGFISCIYHVYHVEVIYIYVDISPSFDSYKLSLSNVKSSLVRLDGTSLLFRWLNGTTGACVHQTANQKREKREGREASQLCVMDS